MRRSWVQRILATRAGQALKQPLRSAIARTGYELVPAERDSTARFSLLVADSDVSCVIDVGANQGQFAEHMRAMGFDGSIISFEPGGAAYSLLSRHASADSLWDVRRMALGASDGTADLHVARNSVSSSLLSVAGTHLAAAPESATGSTETVEVRRLDDELADLSGGFWLKVDTQGYELQVLRGGEETLARTTILQLEVSFARLYDDQVDWLDLLKYVQEHGFSVIDVLPGFRDRSGDLLQCDILARRV